MILIAKPHFPKSLKQLNQNWMRSKTWNQRNIIWRSTDVKSNTRPIKAELRRVVYHPGLQIVLASQNGNHGSRADSTWSYD